MESVASNNNGGESMSEEEEPLVPILLVGNKSDLCQKGQKQVEEK